MCVCVYIYLIYIPIPTKNIYNFQLIKKEKSL